MADEQSRPQSLVELGEQALRSAMAHGEAGAAATFLAMLPELAKRDVERRPVEAHAVWTNERLGARVMRDGRLEVLVGGQWASDIAHVIVKLDGAR